MITTYHSTEEVLDEYRKDYQEVIRSRFFGYIESHKKKIKTTQKIKEASTKEIAWVKCSGVRKINTSRGNSYRAILKGRFDSGRPGFLSTTYLILNDGVTGMKVVYLMPAGNEDKGIIKISPKFFTEYSEAYELTYSDFESCVENFMRTDKYFTLYSTNKPEYYNCQVDLGNDMVGFGNLNGSVFYLRHFWKQSSLLNEAITRKIESRDPLTIYLNIREETTKKELTDIDKAWEEYYKGGH